jgi:uroporphyrinogen-III synthase
MASALAGKRVVVTRSAQQSATLLDRLSKLGAKPVAFPTISLVPMPAPELKQAIAHIEQFEWLLFTSANAVRFFLAHLPTPQAVNLSLPRIAAVGPVTGNVLETLGYRAEVIPATFTGLELAHGLGDLNGKVVLLPRAKNGRPEIVNALRSLGAEVNDIALYETVVAKPNAEAMAQIVAGVDVLTFTSPSTANNFYRLVDPTSVASAVVACIGPTTAGAVEALGIKVDVVPSAYTMNDMVDALLTYFEERQPGQDVAA